ncbi:phosphatidylinositol 4-phosphate 5-kinase (macronuclear) [Tetrahymena thermophila SB210]|uniref:Phosphatidylinositol 4-phosphate 5-kinase n=1 Tax=Tetrahymena thermophila (strain SB210) TaxID=312017 RepID=I7M965_TETTS|nr:phosphatidylinositol 4-phosphate 5-kinase [Tetrahymena thermophila SB210]EAS00880.2 phosphatidylinositol 4-phosphate 5-kinase [Tetrahymena thermophila SB210]|eukprot:XP_001021126.2 phosphatidylinositol 4-phosphate 5-kinase [Tetrahymena thermophila SB210]
MSLGSDAQQTGLVACVIASQSDFISLSSVIKYLQTNEFDSDKKGSFQTFFIDYEGCSMQDQIQYIQIKPPHLNNSYMFQILNLSQSYQVFQVEIDIFFQSNSICLDQCSIDKYQNSQNTCHESLCQCSDNYIGQRCQVHVNKFSDGEQNIQVEVKGFSWVFYELDLLKIQNEYTLTVNDLNQQIKYSIIESGLSSYQVPSLYQGINVIDQAGSYRLQNDIIQDYQAFASINKSQQLSFLISFYNPSNQTLMFSFQFSSQLNQDDSSDEKVKTRNIIVIVVCLIASAVSIPIIYRVVNNFYASKQDIIIPSQPAPVSPYNIHLVQAQLQKKNGSLSKELIEKFMPAVFYADLLTKYQNLKEFSECMICLTDFEESNLCRMTVCYHLFHKNCLESWLELQDSCPFCRKELNKQTLEENKLQSQENPYINRIVQSSNIQKTLSQDKNQEYPSFNDLGNRKNSQQFSEKTNFTSQENSHFLSQSPSSVSKNNKIDYNQADSVIQDEQQDNNFFNVKNCNKSSEKEQENCSLRQSRIKISFLQQLEGDEVGIQSNPQQLNTLFCENFEKIKQQQNRISRLSIDNEEIMIEEPSKLNEEDSSCKAFSKKNNEFYIQQNSNQNEQSLIQKQSIESTQQSTFNKQMSIYQITQQDHSNRIQINKSFSQLNKSEHIQQINQNQQRFIQHSAQFNPVNKQAKQLLNSKSNLEISQSKESKHSQDQIIIK